MDIYIVYEINFLPLRRDDHFTFRNAIFGAEKVTKTLTKINTNIQYVEYGSIIMDLFHCLMTLDLAEMK